MSRSISSDPPWGPAERSIVTVGLFDGVHLGHRKIIKELCLWAAEAGATPVVMTFDRHPGEVLRGTAPPLIDAPAFRVALLRSLGVEKVWLLELSREFLSQTAAEFLERFVAGALNGTGLLVGFNNLLGSDRAGFEKLRREGERCNIEVRSCGPCTVGGEAVSSTLARRAVQQGELGRARLLLGRPPVLCGRVIQGRGWGRRFGFPTANLALAHGAVLPCGVYAGQTRWAGRPYLAAVSIGTCPTLRSEPVPAGRGAYVPGEHTVEVHLLDFNGDLTGADLAVAVNEKLREEKRFPSPEDLIAQIKRDLERVRAVGFDGQADLPALEACCRSTRLENG